MIADLYNSHNIRLITRNVMSIYSSNDEYLDRFVRKLKHSDYLVNDVLYKSDRIISYIKKDYNIYENVFRFVSRIGINTYKFMDYLYFLGLSRVLYLHFCDLDNDTLATVELLIQLSSDKPIVITDNVENLKLSSKIYSLLFHVGLEDRLIIVPFKDIKLAVNNSTCQCYVKSDNHIKIKSKFPNKFLNEEFGTCCVYYNGLRPRLYVRDKNAIHINSYKYSLYELVMIFLFSIKMLYISLFNWRCRLT